MDVEQAVKQALNKALGIVEEIEIVQPLVEALAVEHQNPLQIKQLELELQARALNLTIEQYLIDAENDDEEAILLLGV